jgi:hypothetical protein
MSLTRSDVARACLSLVPLLLVACMPNTTADFRSSSPGTVEFVAPVEFHQAYQLVARNTLRCQGGSSGYLAPVGSSFVMVPGGQNKVEGKVHPGGAHATVTVAFSSAAESGFLQVIDIESVSRQESRVTVYRLNRSPKWKAAAEAVRGWFDGQNRC